MQKHYLSKIIDNIFLIVSVFLLSFLWIRFYSHNKFITLIIASSITIIICSCVHFIVSKKTKMQTATKKQANLVQNLSNFFMLTSKIQVLAIFQKAILSRKCACEQQKGVLVFGEFALLPIFSKPRCDDYDILTGVKKIKTLNLQEKKLIICAKNFTQEAKNFAGTLTTQQVLLLDEFETYNMFFKPINYIISTNAPKSKPNFRQKLRKLSFVMFSKQRFKGYVLSAIVLIIGSYFMRYNIYYLVMSSILILLSIFCYFNKLFNQTSKDIFENKNSNKN